MRPTGPCPATIMIVGEAPTHDDLWKGEPFTGPAGDELSRMLHEAGLSRSACFVTLAARKVPPKGDPGEWVSKNKNSPGIGWVKVGKLWFSPEVAESLDLLQREIELCRPNVIVACGNLALALLGGEFGVKAWRGSTLPLLLGTHKAKVVPIYSPRAVLQDWSVRAMTVHDLRARVAAGQWSPDVVTPKYDFVIRPKFDQAVNYLTALLGKLEQREVKLSVDIETRAGHIACVGFSESKTQAFCIPLMCIERWDGYWAEGEEVILWRLMRKVLCHRNARCIGQNFVYDMQYFWRWLLVKPTFWFDTMIGHHLLFPGTPKGLSVLASLHCEHYVYWKDDGKEWEQKKGEDTWWWYNCQDCAYTYEIAESLFPAAQAALPTQWDFQQNVLQDLLFRAMIRGIRVDVSKKSLFAFELREEITKRETWIREVLGHELNIKSPKQMKELFYDDLKLPVIKSKKTHAPTLDDKALERHARKFPELGLFIRKIQELRSLGVFLSTFVEARLDRDQRIRSSYNGAGTETFRLSSSENAFGSGLNLQNIPKGTEGDDHTALQLPNVRKLYIPDPGYTIFDMDLDRADLQVVVWEADDDELRQALSEGVDLHTLNAKTLFNLSGSLEEIKKRHPDKRQLAKSWVHGTNYGGGPRTMAMTCGITVREAERLQERWFAAHPGIKRWHTRQEALLRTKRIAENRFGYRHVFFDRIDNALPQALAWVPQSTVACVINRAWESIATKLPEVEILVQVHDSLVGQFPTSAGPAIIPRILDAAKIVIPYERPLIIPAGIKTSTISWGDCE